MTKVQIEDPVQFWNGLYERGTGFTEIARVRPDEALALRAALTHFGDVRGKTVLDIGCGNGAASLHFARLGAQVIALDNSSVAIHRLNQYCAANGIHNLRAIEGDAEQSAELGPVDLIYGSMILHHLEPFELVATALRAALRDGGLAFFAENNSAFAPMVWCRKRIVGRWWVRKYGDNEEFPLTPREVSILRKHFAVAQTFPRMQFAVMIADYILRGHCRWPFHIADKILYGTPMRRYSYLQFLALSVRKHDG